MSKEHTYSNGEVTIVWKPDLCIHSKRCWKGLGQVFKPGEKPWIDPMGATSEQITAQVAQCPSGALSMRNALDGRHERRQEPAQPKSGDGPGAADR